MQSSAVSEQVDQTLHEHREPTQSSPAFHHPPAIDENISQEPVVPDISSMMSAIDQSNIIGAGLSTAPNDQLFRAEMPQIPANEVSSLLGTNDEAIDQQQPLIIDNNMPQMENMGYDQVKYFYFLSLLFKYSLYF